jgi:hypothetical protein
MKTYKLENVKEIIKNYCSVHYPEADGLCNYECGCSFDDLQPCDGTCMYCVPAKFYSKKEEFLAVKITVDNSEQ